MGGLEEQWASSAVDVVVDTILSRRSVRGGFDSTSLPRALLERIVKCGLAAPSSKNSQSWRLHIVTDRSLLRAVAESVSVSPEADSYVPGDPATGLARPDYVSTVVESAEVLQGAPAAIFIENRGVFSDGRENLVNSDRAHLLGSLVGYSFEMIGLGAMIQNMWLTAHAAGVGATFMGDVLVAEDTIRGALGMEGDLVGVLALGFSQASTRPKGTTEIGDGLAVWH